MESLPRTYDELIAHYESSVRLYIEEVQKLEMHLDQSIENYIELEKKEIHKEQ
jgi:hypothetical protein